MKNTTDMPTYTATDLIYNSDTNYVFSEIEAPKTYEIDFTKVRELKDLIDILKVFNFSFSSFSIKDIDKIKHLLKEKE